MRSFWVVLLAASAAVACGDGYTTLDDDQISGGARSGGGGSSTGGTGGRGGATGARAGSGAGGAGRGGTTGGGAGTRQGGASGVGQAGAGGAGTGAAAGAGGERPTSCDDPLVAGDVARLDATDQLETYAVMGNTADELRASINANRGRDYDALTTANLNWTFRDCTNPTWTVALDIVYDMPEWDPPTNADPALVASFAAYIDALWCHEYGHGEIGVECANELYDALSDIPGTADCVALQSTAEAVTESVTAICRATNEQYDAETNHGATMGAVFPPP